MRKIGYAWLACEAFGDNPLAKGYVSEQSGYYTQEPVFANFISGAAAAGWKLVPYEHIEAQQGFPGTSPFVLRAPQGGYFVFGTKTEGSIDMQVFHRPSKVDPASGRPQWMHTVAGYRALDVPPHLIPAQGSQYVYASPKGQPDDGVPADVVLLEAGKPVPKFMLRQANTPTAPSKAINTNEQVPRRGTGATCGHAAP